MERPICISSKAALGVCCASVESIPISTHWQIRECSKESYRNSNWFWEAWVKKKLGLTTLKKRRLRGDLIEMNKVISSKESIEWIKTHKSNEKHRSWPAVNVRWKSLSMRRESLSSRQIKSFCSWATIRDNYFVNRIVQTWYSLPNTIVTSPSLNSLKSYIDDSHLKKIS